MSILKLTFARKKYIKPFLCHRSYFFLFATSCKLESWYVEFIFAIIKLVASGNLPNIRGIFSIVFSHIWGSFGGIFIPFGDIVANIPIHAQNILTTIFDLYCECLWEYFFGEINAYSVLFLLQILTIFFLISPVVWTFDNFNKIPSQPFLGCFLPTQLQICNIPRIFLPTHIVERSHSRLEPSASPAHILSSFWNVVKLS